MFYEQESGGRPTKQSVCCRLLNQDKETYEICLREVSLSLALVLMKGFNPPTGTTIQQRGNSPRGFQSVWKITS